MNRNIKYHGLRERPNYEDIVNYLATEKPKTDYPFDRKSNYIKKLPLHDDARRGERDGPYGLRESFRKR